MNDNSMFPLFLDLRNRNCVVVGGNQIAEAKVRELLHAGAQVKVIAIEVTEEIARWAQTGRVQWENRRYQNGDLRSAFLAITAENRSTNAEVYAEAESANKFCNAVDDIKACNCYAASVVRRGPLQVAISTAGKSPALAQRIRSELEGQFGPEYAAWVEELGEQRRKLFSDGDLNPETRKQMLHQQASAANFESFVKSRSNAIP